MSEKLGETEYQEKLRRIMEMFHDEPDVIATLSAGIKKTNDQYHSPSYADTDPLGFLSGGKARMIAAVEAHTYFPNAMFLTNSHTKGKEDDEPTHARVVADELIEYGIPTESIVLQEKSTNTITEIIELIKVSVENNWHIVSVISNEYQIPRIKEFINSLDKFVGSDKSFENALSKFREEGYKINLVSAEDVLSVRSPHYDALIEKVKKTEAYEQRVAAESRGTERIKDGSYRRSDE
jgi:hypothetical protein